jgi:adenylate kinase
MGTPHVASGDLLRDIRQVSSPLADELTGYMDRGEYVPDELMNRLVLSRLREPDAGRGFILDGFPRTLPQAEALDRAMAEDGREVRLVLYMTAPTEVLLRRIEDRIFCPQCHEIYNSATKPPRRDSVCDVCGQHLARRSDQEPDVMRIRLQEYIRQTQPLVLYYRRKRLLAEVDGGRPIDEVEADVDAELESRGLSWARSIPFLASNKVQ